MAVPYLSSVPLPAVNSAVNGLHLQSQLIVITMVVQIPNGTCNACHGAGHHMKLPYNTSWCEKRHARQDLAHHYSYLSTTQAMQVQLYQEILRTSRATGQSGINRVDLHGAKQIWHSGAICYHIWPQLVRWIIHVVQRAASDTVHGYHIHNACHAIQFHVDACQKLAPILHYGSSHNGVNSHRACRD